MRYADYFLKYIETGDEKYFAEGLEDFDYILNKKIYIFNLYNRLEDVKQRVALKLWQSLDNYDSDKLPIKSYLKIVADRGIMEYMTEQMRNKRQFYRKADRLDKNVYSDNEYTLKEFVKGEKSAEEYALTEMKIAEIREKLKEKLSDMEYKSLFLRTEGYSYDEIADKIGSHNKGVDNALQRVKSKLKGGIR